MRLAVGFVLLAVLAVGWRSGAERSVRLCRSSQLQARLYFQGATGSLLGGVRIRVLRGRCSLPGAPTVAFTGEPVQARTQTYRMRPRSGRPLTRSLRSGDRLVVDLRWSNWCFGPPPTALLIGLGPTGEVLRFRLSKKPRCDARNRPSRFGYGPFRLVR